MKFLNKIFNLLKSPSTTAPVYAEIRLAPITDEINIMQGEAIVDQIIPLRIQFSGSYYPARVKKGISLYQGQIVRVIEIGRAHV